RWLGFCTRERRYRSIYRSAATHARESRGPEPNVIEWAESWMFVSQWTCYRVIGKVAPSQKGACLGTAWVRHRNRTHCAGRKCLLTALYCRCRSLKRISRRAVHIERRERRDLVHVGIQDTNGRCILAPTGREPDGTVFRELDLGRISGELRFWIERERLVLR